MDHGDRPISKILHEVWKNGWWWGFLTAFVGCNIAYLLLSIFFGWR